MFFYIPYCYFIIEKRRYDFTWLDLPNAVETFIYCLIFLFLGQLKEWRHLFLRIHPTFFKNLLPRRVKIFELEYRNDFNSKIKTLRGHIVNCFFFIIFRFYSLLTLMPPLHHCKINSCWYFLFATHHKYQQYLGLLLGNISISFVIFFWTSFIKI